MTLAILLLLGSAMELPLRAQNTLLIAAGFAPAYQNLSLGDQALVRVKQAVDHILAHQEPNPAILLDRHHNVLKFNAGAARLFAWSGLHFPHGTTPNAVRALFDGSYGLRDCIVGFDALAHEILARLSAEAAVDSSLQDFVTEMEGFRGTCPDPTQHGGGDQVALPIHFRRDNTNLRYFICITTLGTPLDITAQELRIESYFPLDAETEAFGTRYTTSAR